MMLFAYSIYDRKALVYHPPFYYPTDGAAVRAFSDVTHDTSTQMGRHPGDFALYCVGTYNDTKGELAALSPLRHVVDAVALLQKQPDLFAGEAPSKNGSAQPTPELVERV